MLLSLPLLHLFTLVTLIVGRLLNVYFKCYAYNSKCIWKINVCSFIQYKICILKKLSVQSCATLSTT